MHYLIMYGIRRMRRVDDSASKLSGQVQVINIE